MRGKESMPLFRKGSRNSLVSNMGAGKESCHYRSSLGDLLRHLSDPTATRPRPPVDRPSEKRGETKGSFETLDFFRFA